MKNILITLVLAIFALPAFSQVKIGFRLGVSSQDLTPDQLIIKDENNNDNLGIKLDNANYGVHVGFFAQFKGQKFFVQPEILYNASKVDYRLDDIGNIGIVKDLFTESYQSLDIPVNMGFRLGPVRLQAGPVAHVFIGSDSQLDDIQGYNPDFETLSFGWQAGLGLDIWKFIIDLKYEGNFSQWGNHFNFFGRDYSFDQAPGRLVASVGIAF